MKQKRPASNLRRLTFSEEPPNRDEHKRLLIGDWVRHSKVTRDLAVIESRIYNVSTYL